jgi:NTP pyrophosphatase (non-canonical NTP hydrolase)
MVDERSSGRLVELEEQCLEDSQRWFGDQGLTPADLKHHILALCGEVGEVANLAKKADRGSLDPHSAEFKHDLAMEVADVFTYLLNIAGLLRVDLEAAYYAKRDVNEARFTAARRERELVASRENGAGVRSV